jgi:hypothetical protein
MDAIRRIGFLGLFVCASAMAADAIPGREFSATFEFKGPQGSRRMEGTILVDRFTPVEEARKLRAVLENQGQAGLAAALRGRANGRLRLGALEYTLDLVVTKPTDEGFRLIVVTSRPIRLEETQQPSESLNFPFGVVALDLDESGRGKGQFFPRAALALQEDGALTVQEFEGEGRVSNVKKAR